jgi:hypothetical protein
VTHRGHGRRWKTRTAPERSKTIIVSELFPHLSPIRA